MSSTAEGAVLGQFTDRLVEEGEPGGERKGHGSAGEAQGPEKSRTGPDGFRPRLLPVGPDPPDFRLVFRTRSAIAPGAGERRQRSDPFA